MKISLKTLILFPIFLAASCDQFTSSEHKISVRVDQSPDLIEILLSNGEEKKLEFGKVQIDLKVLKGKVEGNVINGSGSEFTLSSSDNNHSILVCNETVIFRASASGEVPLCEA